MFTKFSTRIAPFVKAELERSISARQAENPELEFRHLENAHVLGQESTYWHVKVHWFMLVWSLRNSDSKELFGQTFRIVGAATKTVFGLRFGLVHIICKPGGGAVYGRGVRHRHPYR